MIREYKAFSFSEWIIKGMIMFLGAAITFMILMFMISSMLYWLQVKRFLMFDALRALIGVA